MPAKPAKLVAQIKAVRGGAILETHEIADFEPVKPFSDSTITVLSKKSTELAQGVYDMNISVYDGMRVLRTINVGLEVHGKGETRLGNFQSFRVENKKVSVGDNVTVAAMFKNTGKEDVNAKFVLSVWSAVGKFVGTVESERAKVAPSGISDFKVNFNAQKAGQYVLKGFIDYDGKKTAEQQIELKISYPLYVKLSIAISFVIAVLIVVLLLMAKKKR
jgi:hypothetical protein